MWHVPHLKSTTGKKKAIGRPPKSHQRPLKSHQTTPKKPPFAHRFLRQKRRGLRHLSTSSSSASRPRFFQSRRSSLSLHSLYAPPGKVKRRTLLLRCQQCEKFLMIFLGMKYILPVVAASYDVIQPTLDLKPRPPCHRCEMLSDMLTNRGIAGLMASPKIGVSEIERNSN